MAQFSIKVKGLDDFSRAMSATADKVDKAAENIVRKGSAIVERNAKLEFKPRPIGSQRTSKSGRIYYSSKKPFQPVPPNPTSRSGNLRNSIHLVKAERVAPGRWASTTAPAMIYGARVELGGGSWRAFPYMKPGLEKSSEALRALYTEEWRKALA